jgi:hypothetical protein
MRRLSLATAIAAIVLSMLPVAVSADRVTKFEDHRVDFGCEGDIAGGFLSMGMVSSEAFGDEANANLWLDDAIPFEDPPTLFGSGSDVAVDEGDPVVLTASLDFFDADGNPQGTGSLVATLTRVGDPVIEGGGDPSNRTSHTVRTIQFLDGEATLALPDDTEFTLACGGEIVDESVFETNPRAFTLNNAGVIINCGWDIEGGGFAFFFAVDDSFGFFADAGLFTADLEIFQTGAPSGSIDAGGVTASLEMTDGLTGDPYTAEAAATFAPLGDLTTSVLTSQTARTKLVEQRLAVDGSLEFSSGDSFAMDTERCFANTFDTHDIATPAGGPKRGPAAANDTPDGAIALEAGDHDSVNTTGTAPDAEVPIATCPDGDRDDLGHTVWYTVEGTGGTLTFDTAGSGFDTVLAVYVVEGGEFVEIACVDDVFFDPIGLTFQAAISGPSEEGVTYWIQVGGFKPTFIDPGIEAQSGHLMVSVTAE